MDRASISESSAKEPPVPSIRSSITITPIIKSSTECASLSKLDGEGCAAAVESRELISTSISPIKSAASSDMTPDVKVEEVDEAQDEVENEKPVDQNMLKPRRSINFFLSESQNKRYRIYHFLVDIFFYFNI
jgi:hypothetical protein